MAASTSRSHRRLLVVVGALLAATLVGLVVLWPSATVVPVADRPPGDVVAGEVVAVEARARDDDGGPTTSLIVTIRVLEGPGEGLVTAVEVLPEGFPTFRVGDRLALAPTDGVSDGYTIIDFHRLPTLWLLLGLFVLAVIAVGRWQGLRSLLGLALSLAIVIRFVVPAILAGTSPPLVALVGALAVMIVTLYLAHGISEMTTAAVVGTAAALLLTIGLGVLFVEHGRITGFASDEAALARLTVDGLDLQGLVLAGLIIAALGVLDDVTVSQASTVFALHSTDPQLSWRALFGRAMKVGRDHIASVVNTLFLAYTGASLALLVLFSTSGVPASELINSELFAQEIVSIVVGSLGLIAAVPLTTALAASMALRAERDGARLAAVRRRAERAAADTPDPQR